MYKSALLVASVSAFDAMWNIEGLKGFYQGAYTSLYKDLNPDIATCLNEETADNLVYLYSQVTTMGSWIGNLEEDFKVFDAYAEIVKDVADCHFENAFIDLNHFCQKEDTDCSTGTLFGNAKGHALSVVGEIAEIGQELSGFPNSEPSLYREEMQMIGEGFGGFVRSIYGFKK